MRPENIPLPVTNEPQSCVWRLGITSEDLVQFAIILMVLKTLRQADMLLREYGSTRNDFLHSTCTYNGPAQNKLKYSAATGSHNTELWHYLENGCPKGSWESMEYVGM
jgi:hypothetical protein